MNHISELVDLIELKRINDNIFSGKSEPIGSANVFGGQVLAQALYAMAQTVPEDRLCNSYHSYFILPGDLRQEILYEVQHIRDGGSFSVRRVTALQNNKVIFFMGASFHAFEQGYDHQIQAPEVPHHSELFSWDDMYSELKDFMPKEVREFLSIQRPITFKPTLIFNPAERKKIEPFQNVWFKIKGETENNSVMNRSLMSYISDYNILSTALHPHADVAHFGNTNMATLDHSMWFFRDFNINDWFLFNIDSPSASEARGFTRGNIFTADGTLIASVTQEGLIRPLT
ncbi:MAG: acyl-CoA thioesterase II [Flavobacteriaceae bacterium]|nr:acyl-CoA thioesterase II [Flavobacteriaceae bacterium]